MCLSQRPLFESKGPLVEKLQLLLPVVLTGNKYEYSARLGWWEGRDSASSSSFVLCVWVRGAGRVLGGTQAKETTEHFCLGTFMLGATSCYKIAFAAHWELLAAKKPLTCLRVLPGVCFCRELQFKENLPAPCLQLRHAA